MIDNLQMWIGIARTATDYSDPYSVGVLNGLILAESILLEIKPEYAKVQPCTEPLSSSFSSPDSLPF
jgi:hypothetical protein